MSKPRPTEAAAQTPSAAGHEANGRFARGNPGGPGNPFARRVAALRKVIIDNVSEEDLPAFYRRRTVLGVNVYAEDIAEAIAFFAGPRSTKSTGNVINVDGGVTAAYPR